MNRNLLLALLPGFAIQAVAVETLDFEGSVAINQQVTSTSYATNGWRFYATVVSSLIGPQYSRVGYDYPSNGSAYYAGSGVTLLARWNFGSFTLKQFDATEGYYGATTPFARAFPGETRITLTGYLQDLSTITYEFVTAPRAATDPSQFQTFVLSEGWTNLRRVRFICANTLEGDPGPSDVPVAFDNIQVVSDDPPYEANLTYEMTPLGLQLIWPKSVPVPFPLLQQSSDFESWTPVPDVDPYGNSHVIQVDPGTPRLWFRIRYAP